MLKFFNTIKYRMSIIVILALLLQIFMPVIENYAYAQEEMGIAGEELEVDEPIEEVETPEEVEEPENLGEEDNGAAGSDIQPTEDKQPEIMDQKPENVETMEVETAGEGESGNYLENIFTFNFLKLGGKDGTDIENGQIIEIEDGTKVSLNFSWDTENRDVKAGDWAEIQLPDAFNYMDISNQDIIVEGTVVGEYSIVDGKLKFVFNEKIEESDVKNGYIGFDLEFNLEKFKENIEQEIKFNDSSDETLTIIAKPTGKVTGIDKEGNPDNQHDAKEITWTIDVLNSDEEAIEEATVKDNIPEGLKLKEGSFVVKELTVGYEGNKVVGSEVDISPTTAGDNDFEFKFSNMAPYKGYRIEYTTTIEDYSKDSFTNDATLSYGDKNLPAEATVDGLTRSDSIEKNGKYIGKDDNGNDLIEWTILVNKSGGEIDNAIVKDELPEELIFVEGSMKVEKFIDNWTSADPQPEGPFNEFPVNLGKVESNEFYRITFKTTVDWSKVNGGNYQQNNKLTNKTELKDGETTVGEAEKTVEVERKSILRKTGKSNVNYDDKTLTWTVHVNEARHPLSNVVLTDILPKGLSIEEKDIVITGEDGKEITPTNVTITPITEGDNKDKTEIKIDLGNIGTDYVKVEYKTTITDFTIDEFKNTASLSGGGIGVEGGGPVDKPLHPGKNTFEKKFESIDYNAKTMNWKLTINPQREAISELKIVDTFPNKGLILLPDTLKVKVGGTKITDGYTLTPNIVDSEEGYQKGFTLEFDNSVLPFKNLVEVTYQTSYDPERGIDPHTGAEGEDRLYKNKAEFIGKTVNKNPIKEEKNAEKKVREDSWNSGKKEGQLVHPEEGGLKDGWVSGAERKIAWQIYTNYQEQNLGNGVSVTDTLAYEGTIDENSVKVSVYEVKSNGETTITDEILDKEDYTVDVNGKEFTLTFKEEVNKRYVIEFTTTVPDISQDEYTNIAKVKVGEDKYPYTGTVNYDKHDNFLNKTTIGLDGNKVFTGDEIDWEVKVNESLSIIKDAKIVDTISKGLVYVNDSLKVYKLVGDKEEPLKQGEDYTFAKSTTEDEKTVLSLEFKKDIDTTLILRYKTVVTETKGQVNNKVELEGTGIENVEIESEELNASQFSWVGGEFDPKKGALRVKKVDAEEKDSDGKYVIIDNNEAKFILEYELNGERVQFGEEFTTEKGVLEIGGLPLRTYYLKEVESPKGYVLSEEEMEILIDKAYGNDEKNIIKIDFKNTKEKVEVTGNKKWDGGPKPEIELQLYRNGVPLEGEEYKVKLKGTEETPWTHTWTNLDKTDIEGNEYKYTVDEVKVPENYERSISEDGLTIINTYVSPKTEVTGKKVWINGPEEKPSIELQLYRNGEAYGDPVTLNDGETEYIWTDLDLTDENGVEYEYTVDEVNVPENYEKEADGLTVTNTYVSPKTEVTGKKVWVNGPEEKPSIELQLYRNGEAYGDPVTLNDGQTEYTWTDLDLTDENGVAYKYTVDEVEVPDNYTKEVSEDGLTITNTYEIPKTTVTGTKVWKGGPKKKPDIELQLYRDGKPFGEPITLKNGQTSYTWDDLDKTDIDGLEYEYTVDEVDVPENYIKEISEDGLTITNTYVSPEKPTKPTKPSKPTKPTTPQKPALPKTGEASNMILYLVGGAFILLGFILRKRMA